MRNFNVRLKRRFTSSAREKIRQQFKNFVCAHFQNFPVALFDRRRDAVLHGCREPVRLRAKMRFGLGHGDEVGADTCFNAASKSKSKLAA